MSNLEESLATLVDTINGLTDLVAWRAENDWLIDLEDEGDSFIVVKIMDTGRKDVISLNHFIGKRENPLYNDYGYLDIFKAYIRVITPSRSISREHSSTIENYLKVNYDNIHTDIVLRRHTFTPQKLFKISRVEVLYGIETSFEFSFANVWDDEPENPESQVDVDELHISEVNQKNINIRVSYDQ